MPERRFHPRQVRGGPDYCAVHFKQALTLCGEKLRTQDTGSPEKRI